jgi:hypothetical protein
VRILIPTMTSSRFSSTIRLVTKAEYDVLIEDQNEMDEEGEYANWGDGTVEEFIGERVSLKTRGYTTGARDCNAGGFQNGKRMTMFHVHPSGLEKFKPELHLALRGDIQTLKQEGPVRGLITGGWAFDDDEREKASKSVFWTLRSIMRSAGVKDISMLWGRYDNNHCGDLDLFYDIRTDTWSILAKNLKGKSIVTWKPLKDTFRFIRIAPGDTLIVRDRKPIAGPYVLGRDPKPEPDPDYKQPNFFRRTWPFSLLFGE